MNNKKNRQFPVWLMQGNLWENLALVILAFYPLRHISKGLDLWDTGYNYANFRYFGTEHMDPMWFFSTYLANAAGNFLTKLPNGDSLMGMNLYTGLFVSGMALLGYFFCTRKLKMPKILVFVGEMTAISLCWCPTALLYNYLTYFLFLVSALFLYTGLTRDRKYCLAAAGVLLGTNVLVRFSNLPEMGMIVAVWAYDFIRWRQERKSGSRARGNGGEPEQAEGFWHRTVRHTLWCAAGYGAALLILLNYIHICFGLENYIEGIRRLFDMTEKAPDYKPLAMIMGIVGTYVENLYWVIRIGIITAGGAALFAAGDCLERLGRRRRKEGGPGFWPVGMRLFWILVSGAMLWWLYDRGFCSLLFYSYDSMLRPGILFLMLTMLIGVIRIFSGSASGEEKLVSGMIILMILLTSLGSNNGVYPSLNNLFLAAPYTFWESWRFLRFAKDRRLKCRGASGRAGLLLAVFPVKAVLTAFLGLCLFQFAGFGAGFVFAEATGVREADAFVDNNEVLKNIRMSSQRAGWMKEISAYVTENGLEGQQVILYGDIPALSFYLQMPSAFNPWSDLDSYATEVMEKELDLLSGLIGEKGREKPVIIVENLYALYREEGAAALEAAGVTEEKRQEMTEDRKWSALVEFMEKFGYGQTFRNEKFALYQAAE